MPNLNIKIINKSDVLYFDPFYKTAWVLKLQKYTSRWYILTNEINRSIIVLTLFDKSPYGNDKHAF